MTKENFKKFHNNTIREVDYYSKEIELSSVDFINLIQNETFGCDEYGNPSDETYSFVAEKYNLPLDVARHFYLLS